MSAPYAVRFGPRSPLASTIVVDVEHVVGVDDEPQSNGPRAMRPEELAKVLARLA